MSNRLTSLDFLQAVYMNKDLPLHTRMRAAMALLPFQHPKLAVTAVVTPQDMAARLERAKARSDSVRLIPAQPEALPPAPKAPPRLAPDQRFQRRF